MLSAPAQAKNDHMNKAAAKQITGTVARATVFATGVHIVRPANSGRVLEFAARELADGLGAMLSRAIGVRISDELRGARLALVSDGSPSVMAAGPDPEPASYSIAPGPNGILLSGADQRDVLDAVYALMRDLGARFPLGGQAIFPRIDPASLGVLKPVFVQPPFSRRCLVSDIMTWHYEDPPRFAMHLAHDREFIPWMARSGINAFFFIRHAIDTRYRIEELEAMYRERGIELEYGGHVLQQLLPRERFADNPDYFPAAGDGSRNQLGNLCVSSQGAIAVVRKGASGYLKRHPESRLLHVWGADVWEGAWCLCERCRGLAPQLQYLQVVNEIAGAAHGAGTHGAVAYLAYHDTLEPAPGMKPHRNAWFEWAPRERCYSHAIDDPDCETNPRYFNSLNRYLESFEGRGHVFEYYADAILFGGMGFATPSVIARDLRAYHALGLRSVSCLTFGAFSILAYPVNLVAFAKLAIDLNWQPDAILADAAAQRHPGCGSEMADAYRAVQRASGSVLTYGDVMWPSMSAEAARKKRMQLQAACAQLRVAIDIAESVYARYNDPIVQAERNLWSYGLQTLSGIAEYLAAREDSQPASRGIAAIDSVRRALERIRAITPDVIGTWGNFDLERFHSIWVESLRQTLGKPLAGD